MNWKGTGKGFLAAVCAMGIALITLALTPPVPAAPSDKAGTSPYDNGRKMTDEQKGINQGDDYGDLWVILRDSNGVPVPDSNGCVQPYYIKEDGYPETIPINNDCEVTEETNLQEVEFGRLNLARSTQEVLDAAYEEALTAINAAEAIGLDPAGRLLLTLDGVQKTIDSPLENLALYQQLMKTGGLPLAVNTELMNHLIGGTLDEDDLLRAAAFLAGGADKTGHFTIDMIVYLNNFLGINDPAYFSFSAMNFSYDSSTAFGNAATLLQGPYTLVSDTTVDPGKVILDEGSTVYVVEKDVEIPQDILSDAQPWAESESTLISSGDAFDFLQAADDALQVIEYIHNLAIPE